MAHIFYTDNITAVPAAWLNDVDVVTYTYFGNGTSRTGNLQVPGSTTLTGTVQIGIYSSQYGPFVNVRFPGPSIEFGHNNPAGYASVLGAQASNGNPYLAFNAGPGTNVNSYKTLGLKGAVLTSDLGGGFLFLTIPTASADNQVGTLAAALDTNGKFTTNWVAAPLVATSGAVNLGLGVNGVTHFVIDNSNNFYPSTDNVKSFGISTNRIGAVFTTTIDSGTTASLNLRTNNGKNGAEILGSSGANETWYQLAGDVAAGGPVLNTISTATNQNCFIQSKGTGSLIFRSHSGSSTQHQILAAASAVNYTFSVGSATGVDPVFGSNGSDAGVGLRITGGGTGNLNFYTSNTADLQFQIIRTAGSTRNITVTGSNGGNPILDTTAGSLLLKSAGVSGITVTSGNAIIASSLGLGATAPVNGVGITFPASQSASTDVNTLDDYEEGTWTPSLGGNTTYLQQTGQYVKIGRVVYVIGLLNINVIGTGSTTQISGLPFTVTSTNGMSPGASIDETSGLATNVVSMVGRFDTGATTVRIMSRTAAAGTESINAIFASGATLTLAGFYFV